jgi:hypothetical protein
VPDFKIPNQALSIPIIQTKKEKSAAPPQRIPDLESKTPFWGKALKARVKLDAIQPANPIKRIIDQISCDISG